MSHPQSQKLQSITGHRLNSTKMKELMQLELFEPEKVDQYAHLYAHWEKDLGDWHREVFEFRHFRNTTGWSMACSGFIYAKMLFQSGKITRNAFRRYWKFDRRVRRWNLIDQAQARRTGGVDCK